MTNELILMYGDEPQGGRRMARKRTYSSYYDSRTGTRVKRRRRTPGTGSILAFDGFGQATTMLGTFEGIKGVLITGGIAAGGALVTDKVFAQIQERLKTKEGEALFADWQATIAKAATGIALALVIAKVLKKPRLAAAFAIGPIAAAALDLIHTATGDVHSVAGVQKLGLTTVSPAPAYYPDSMYAGVGNMGALQVGTGVPERYMNSEMYAQPY